MKKLILPIIVFAFILQSFFWNAYAQEEPSNKLTCDQIWSIVGTDKCKNWVVSNDEGGVWCNLPESSESLQPWIYGPPSTYTFTPGTCKAESGDEPKEELESDQPKPSVPTAKSLNDWIKDNFEEVDFEALEAESLYGRTPKMTDEIVKNAQAEWKAMTENIDFGKSESPYRLDILNGEIQIKLPGQNEWSDLKQGDKIPPGSTIFTGMDTTTVLSIRDKGVVQVQSFTEITISEKGFEEAAKTGQTYTDIELHTGEIEVNIEGGIYPIGGSSMYIDSVYTTSSVRGTHFWVKHDDKKKTDTIGVYEGTVEVKIRGNDKSVMVSPNGTEPGVVVISQKLSILKLVFVGVVLMVIIGGVILFIKKSWSPSSGPNCI